MSKSFEALTLVGQAMKAKFPETDVHRVSYDRSGDINSTQHTYLLTAIAKKGSIFSFYIMINYIPYGGASYSFHLSVSNNNEVVYSKTVEISSGQVNGVQLLEIIAEEFKMDLRGYTMEETEVAKVEVSVKVDTKSLQADKFNKRVEGEEFKITQEQVDKAIVIAHRIIKHKKNVYEFEISGTSGFDGAVNGKYMVVQVRNIQSVISKKDIAFITIVGDKFYVEHKDLHHDEERRLSRGVYTKKVSEKMRATFDHWCFGMEYKKFIDLNELK